MELKRALKEDINELRKTCIDAYSRNFHHHWNDGGLEWYLDREFSNERLTSDLADKNTKYYFINHQGKSVGFIKIKNSSLSNLEPESCIELEKIYVLPEHKGMGIGKLALRDVFKKAIDDGKKNLFLSVIDTNKNAITFYESLGFKFHSTTTLDIPFFKEELKGMIKMVKELDEKLIVNKDDV